jgi:hypothetical protein
MLIAVPQVADDGTFNEIDLVSDVLDPSYFTAKVNDTDATKRWYPVSDVIGIVDERGDPVTETIDTTDFKVADGARTFFGQIALRESVFLGKLKQAGCVKFGFYIVDVNGSLIGNASVSGKLRPIIINEGTWDPKLVKASKTTIPKVSIAFTYSDLERDEDLKMIKSTEMTEDILNLRGLIDVNSTISSITTTSFTATLTFDYGTAPTADPFEGAVAVDFTLEELSPSAGAIVITSVTESAAGVYDFVHPTETAADVLETKLSKNGFIMEETTHTV